MSHRYTVQGTILGKNEPFSVNINSNQPVSELKNCIKTKNKQALHSFDARNLTLYKVDINISTTHDYHNAIKAISENSFEWGHMKKLESPFIKLSEVKGSFLDNRIHILILNPPTVESSTSSYHQCLVTTTTPPNPFHF